MPLPERIVYVDDDKLLRKTVQQALEKAGQDIVLVTCSTGQELLSRFRELQPDVILLDLIMPDMDGPEVLERLSEARDGFVTPVIFVTKKSKVVMTEEYKRLGVIGVIHKPFNPDKLPQAVAAMWKAHRMETGELNE